VTLDFSYDKDTDVLTVEGIRYHGDIFRTMAIGPVPGQLLQILKRDDTVVWIKTHIVDEACFEAFMKRQDELRFREMARINAESMKGK
jgi:hypothetical protein